MNDDEIIDKAWDSFNYPILTIKGDFHNAVGKAIVLARADTEKKWKMCYNEDTLKVLREADREQAFVEVLEWAKKNAFSLKGNLETVPSGKISFYSRGKIVIELSKFKEKFKVGK